MGGKINFPGTVNDEISLEDTEKDFVIRAPMLPEELDPALAGLSPFM
jgi:hypothetical protein